MTQNKDNINSIPKMNTNPVSKKQESNILEQRGRFQVKSVEPYSDKPNSNPPSVSEEESGAFRRPSRFNITDDPELPTKEDESERSTYETLTITIDRVPIKDWIKHIRLLEENKDKRLSTLNGITKAVNSLVHTKHLSPLSQGPWDYTLSPQQRREKEQKKKEKRGI